MSYEEALESDVSQREAIREYEKHGHNAEALFADLGVKEVYSGKEVLEALGY